MLLNNLEQRIKDLKDLRFPDFKKRNTDHDCRDMIVQELEELQHSIKYDLATEYVHKDDLPTDEEIENHCKKVCGAYGYCRNYGQCEIIKKLENLKER